MRACASAPASPRSCSAETTSRRRASSARCRSILVIFRGDVARRPALSRRAPARGHRRLRIGTAAIAVCTRAGRTARELARGAGAAAPLPRSPQRAFHRALRVGGGRAARARALASLEAAQLRVARALGVGAARPITVVLYTREQFDRITRLATWSVAGFDGRIRVPLGGTAFGRGDLDRILSTSWCTPSVVRLGERTVPAWMSEGLATVLEPAGSDDVEAAFTRGRGCRSVAASSTGLRACRGRTPKSPTRRPRAPSAGSSTGVALPPSSRCCRTSDAARRSRAFEQRYRDALRGLRTRSA